MSMSGYLISLLQVQPKAEPNCQLPRLLVDLNCGAATREIAIHFAQVRDVPDILSKIQFVDAESVIMND